MNRSVIIGTGSCLPKKILTNIDLEKMVDTSDEWIIARTGIKERRIADKGEETSKLAAAAARNALAMAKCTPDEIDLIIVATMTCEKGMPSCACLVQQEIEAINAFAFDLNAACSGFLYALDLADKYINNDHEMKVLVIGAENLSTRINWQDRNTCVLFGDGAGGCVVTGSTHGSGLLASRLFADGSLGNLLQMDNSTTSAGNNSDTCIKMAGRDVFKYAVRAMENAVNAVLRQENISIDQVNLLIPHQANIRILKNLAAHLSIPLQKIYINLHKYGNTSAATIPLALDEANRAGQLQPDDLLLLCAFGGGFTWGATLLRW